LLLALFTIHLNNLYFFSFHGLYEEEKVLGNEFEVNIAVSVNADQRITELHETVNYVSIYNIIKQKMDIPTLLLETVVQDIADAVYESDSRILSINISIRKLHLPISNFTGNASVSLIKNFII
jgi:dihydroneopterin aldolase